MLERVRSLQLPVELFADVPDARVAAWRARAALEHPAWLRTHRREARLTVLACLCWTRVGEITDALIELFIGIVHKINARAERRVETELLDDLRRVRSKQGLLFAIAAAAVTRPEDTVRAAIYPYRPRTWVRVPRGKVARGLTAVRASRPLRRLDPGRAAWSCRGGRCRRG